MRQRLPTRRRLSRLLLLISIPCEFAAAQPGEPMPARSPVLVELFTSEGCSSCPPADRLLQQLDSRAIVLSEHVDYWDHHGWKDPFSAHVNTERQEAYGRMFNLQSVYTPEMVIDGAVEFTGSDALRAMEEIARAERRKKARLHIARTDVGLRIEADLAPAAASVFLALADEAGESHVRSGENGGRQLHHVAIARSIRKIGSVKRSAPWNQEIELGRGAAQQRVIVFLQEAGMGRVSAAAMLPPVSSNSGF